MRHARVPLLLLGLLLASGALAALPAAPAHAAGYRYWSFWQGGGDASGWTYSAQGPGTARPGDGDVDGWRFAVSPDGGDGATAPRTAPDFGAVCGGTPAEGGTKRVAVVIDFGTAADAPGGERPPRPRAACARVPRDATSADALAAVAEPLRYNSQALLCAIAGYPESGCGESVSSGDGGDSGAEESRAASRSGDARAAGSGSGGGDGAGPSVTVWAGLGAVGLLGAAAVWQARRRRVR